MTSNEIDLTVDDLLTDEIKEHTPTLKTCSEISNWFSYHTPENNQSSRYEKIRNEAKKLAFKIIFLTPESEEQKDSIQKLRECVMLANAAIACNEVDNAN